MDLYPLPQVAIYVKDPPGPRHGLLPKEGQETACREYCSDRQYTVSAVYADPPDRLDKLIALATSAEAPFDAIAVWKTSRIAVSLEETISLRDQLRRAGTKLLSVTEEGIED